MPLKDKIKTKRTRKNVKAKLFVPRPVEPPEVIEARWKKKKDQIHELANNISRLRLNVSKDLKETGDEKLFLTALIIAIIDKTGERIGNNDSARVGHFGVSGFRKRHIKIDGNQVTLKYRGKSGVDQEKTFNSEKIAKALKQAIKNSPDKRVFTTTEGQWIGSDQVSRYLSTYSISAKSLRGFYVNQAMVQKLQSMDIPEKEKDRKKLFTKTCKSVAANVGHGSGTCKKHYIVPELPEQYILHGKIIDLKSQKYYKDGGSIKSEESTENSIKPEFVGIIQGTNSDKIGKRSEGNRSYHRGSESAIPLGRIPSFRSDDEGEGISRFGEKVKSGPIEEGTQPLWMSESNPDIRYSKGGEIEVYHGGYDIGPDLILKSGHYGGKKTGSDSGAIFFTPSLKYAKGYARDENNVYKYNLKVTDKIFDGTKEAHYKKLKDGYLKNWQNEYSSKEDAIQDYELAVREIKSSISYGAIDWGTGSQFLEQIEKAGFEGIKFLERSAENIQLEKDGSYKMSGPPVYSYGLFKDEVKVQRYNPNVRYEEGGSVMEMIEETEFQKRQDGINRIKDREIKAHGGITKYREVMFKKELDAMSPIKRREYLWKHK